MKSARKIVLVVLGVIAAILVASLGRYIGGSTVDYAYGKYKQTAAERSIEEQLEQGAEELNKQLSSAGMSNDQIRMDSVTAGPGRQLTFLFTVCQLNQLTDEHLRGLFVGNRDRLCSSNLRRLLDSGVTFNYRYRDNDARWTREVTVRPTDYSP